MNSINKELDRLDGQIASLLQKVEDLQSENQRLLQKINALENSLAIAPQKVDIQHLRSSLDQYISQLDQCIDAIKLQ